MPTDAHVVLDAHLHGYNGSNAYKCYIKSFLQFLLTQKPGFQNEHMHDMQGACTLVLASFYLHLLILTACLACT